MDSRCIVGSSQRGKRGSALTNKMDMEVLLRYLADPGFQNSVSEVAGVSQSTINKYVNTAAHNWQNKKRFPFCFGVVDGCLFNIQKPRHQYNPAEYYLDRKKFYCLNVQVTCDVDYKITSVYILVGQDQYMMPEFGVIQRCFTIYAVVLQGIKC